MIANVKPKDSMQTPPQPAPSADQFGFIDEDSPFRPIRRRVSAAAIIITVLTTAALFGGIGFAVGFAFSG